MRVGQAQLRRSVAQYTAQPGQNTWQYSGDATVLQVEAQGTTSDSTLEISGGRTGAYLIITVTGAAGSGITVYAGKAYQLSAGQSGLFFFNGSQWQKCGT